jgi:ribosomal protein S27AE
MPAWIFTGHKQESKELRRTVEKYCVRCGTRTPHSATVVYEYDHLQFIIAWVTSSQVRLRCTRCGDSQLLSEEEEEKYFPESPVPWTKEYSVFIFAGVLAALIVGGILFQNPIMCVPVGIILIIFIFLAMLKR